MRVCELDLNQYSSGHHFMYCSCEYRTRVGVPCQCFVAAVDNDRINDEKIVDMGMVDVGMVDA